MTEKSNLVALADAVADWLNAELAADSSAFALAFTARRRFAEVADLASIKDADDPLVALIPHADKEDREGGEEFDGVYEINCIIYARVGAGDAAEAKCETLMLLRDQIRDSFKDVQLKVTGLAEFNVAMVGVEAVPAYGMDSLVEKHVFCGSQVMTFNACV